MITEWLINFVTSLFVDFVTGIPAPDILLGDISGGIGWAMAFNSIAPLDAMLASGLVLFAVSTTMFLVQLIRYLVSFLPLVGGSGD